MPGSVLADRYRVTSLIGRGGMGEVYRATDLFLSQPVALKFLNEALAGDQAARERLINEVRTAREITHPNVCRVHDIGEVEGQLYISMEYVDGEDLASLISRIARLPPDKATEVAACICSGLAAAHQKGVLHRDLKPANIMLDGRGNTRIMDFGLAATGRVGSAEARHGTPAYMAPEQLAGEAVSVKSDIYALGLVLFEIFTGRRPFEANSTLELLDQRRRGLAARPSTTTRDLDPNVERIIVACLDPDPARRPESALSVASALPLSNPLAAALAAGRTPSPEVVAEGFGEAGLGPRAGLTILCGILLGLALSVVLTAKLGWLSRIPLDRQPDELVSIAKRIASQAGYAARPRDSAYAFAYDQSYLSYIRKAKVARSTIDSRLIRFWYRESDSYLEGDQLPNGMVPPGAVTPDDPPMSAGMSMIDLDPQGRLLRLEAIPAGQSDRLKPTGAFDWSPFFAAAGLKFSAFTAVDPASPAPVPSDAEAAWTGENSSGEKLRVQAALSRGRLVYFDVIAPWMTGSSRLAFSLTKGQAFTTVLLLCGFFLAIFGALLLVRHNLRLGRGDRANASRVAGFVFALSMAVWILRSRHSPTLHEISIGVFAFGWSLAMAALVWTLYVALEPYVRRHWPGALVSFSRLLMGRIKDPLVARDVLIGCAYAVAWVLLFDVREFLNLSLGSPGGLSLQLSALSPRRFAAGSLFSFQVAIWGVFVLFTMILLLRAILKRQSLAIGVLAAFFTLAGAVADPHPFFAAPILAIHSSLLVWVLARFGVVAWIVGATAGPALEGLPYTADLANWYAVPPLISLALFAALSVYAWKIASWRAGPNLEKMLQE